MKYRECDVCGFRANLPDGVDGSNFVGWGKAKNLDLCPECNPKYVNLENEMDNKKNEALNKFLKL